MPRYFDLTILLWFMFKQQLKTEQKSFPIKIDKLSYVNPVQFNILDCGYSS